MNKHPIHDWLVQWLVIRCWRRVLGHKPRHPDETFFDAGGDSLMVVEFTDDLRDLLGVELPIDGIVGWGAAEIIAWTQRHAVIAWPRFFRQLPGLLSERPKRPAQSIGDERLNA